MPHGSIFVSDRSKGQLDGHSDNRSACPDNVALTISGAGANVPEFVILGRLFQRRLLVVFVGYVFAVAMIGGFLAAAIVG